MSDWTPLRDALARSRAAQVAVPLWWRDDDAVTPTPALDVLHQMASDLGIPVHLAVIPSHARQSLGTYVAERSDVIPLVHGWSHENMALNGQESSEFPTADVAALARLKDGLAALKGVFAGALLPVFVPPWNRMHPDLGVQLRDVGYLGASTFGPRQPAEITTINTHIDPIFWRGHRGLADADTLITLTAQRINARLDGHEDAREPLGYLTHHLVHTPEIWAFSNAFLSEMLDGGAVVADLEKELT